MVLDIIFIALRKGATGPDPDLLVTVGRWALMTNGLTADCPGVRRVCAVCLANVKHVMTPLIEQPDGLIAWHHEALFAACREGTSRKTHRATTAHLRWRPAPVF